MNLKNHFALSRPVTDRYRYSYLLACVLNQTEASRVQENSWLLLGLARHTELFQIDHDRGLFNVLHKPIRRLALPALL